MNYSELFDTLYSESISEDVKELVVERVLDEAVMRDADFLEESIHESNSKVSAYQEALSYLVNSNISEEAMMETLDLMFANESEEVIGQVEEAFKEDVAKGILVSTLLEDFTETHKPLYKKQKELEGADYYRKRTPIEKAKLATQSKAKELADKAKDLGTRSLSKAKKLGSGISTGITRVGAGAFKKVENLALKALKNTVGKVFSKKEANPTNIGKGDGSFRSKEPAKVEMNKGTGEFRGKSKGPAPVGLAALRRAHGEEPIQKTEPKKETETPKTETPKTKVSFQGDFAGKVKDATEERKEKVKRGEGSVSTGRSNSDDIFNVDKQNKENKEISKSSSSNQSQESRQLGIPSINQQDRNSDKINKRIEVLKAAISKYEEQGTDKLKANQKAAYARKKAELSKLQTTNESLNSLSSCLNITESLIINILEMTKPSKETYEKLGKKHKEAFDQAVENITPRRLGDIVIKPTPAAIQKAEEVSKKYAKVQTRAKKEANIDV